jgi:cellular nucleic acid-binding protein
MTNIYIIKLEDNKYYVGKTNNLERRKQEHIDGNASAWTNKYKPIAIEKIIPNASPFDEDKYTKEYMAKFGIDNVRGGSYAQINLNAAQIESLNREIKGATDACHNCGEIGHYIKYCSKKHFLPTLKDNPKNNIEYECEYCDRTFTTAFGCGVHKKSCKKKNIEYECEYCDRTFTTAFGCGIHEKLCKEKKK